MSLLSKKPRPVATIVGDITKMIQELTGRAEDQRKQAAVHTDLAEIQQDLAAGALNEADNADRIAGNFKHLLT